LTLPSPIDFGSKKAQLRPFLIFPAFSYARPHIFTLGDVRDFPVTNLRFGHSYGYLDPEMLWNFSDWITEMSEDIVIQDEKTELRLDWAGLLPYPEPDGPYDIEGIQGGQ
jgi:hypothetical protein